MRDKCVLSKMIGPSRYAEQHEPRKAQRCDSINGPCVSWAPVPSCVRIPDKAKPSLMDTSRCGEAIWKWPIQSLTWSFSAGTVGAIKTEFIDYVRSNLSPPLNGTDGDDSSLFPTQIAVLTAAYHASSAERHYRHTSLPSPPTPPPFPIPPPSTPSLPIFLCCLVVIIQLRVLLRVFPGVRARELFVSLLCSSTRPGYSARFAQYRMKSNISSVPVCFWMRILHKNACIA